METSLAAYMRRSQVMLSQAYRRLWWHGDSRLANGSLGHCNRHSVDLRHLWVGDFEGFVTFGWDERNQPAVVTA